MHIHNAPPREVLLTSLQATDPGGTITMVTASGRSFTRQIKTEDTAVQETNPATQGELVFGNWSIPLKHYKVTECLILWLSWDKVCLETEAFCRTTHISLLIVASLLPCTYVNDGDCCWSYSRFKIHVCIQYNLHVFKGIPLLVLLRSVRDALSKAHTEGTSLIPGAYERSEVAWRSV